MQPCDGSQKPAVHWSVAQSAFDGMWMQPATASQESTVHGLSSAHDTGVPPTHAPATHVAPTAHGSAAQSFRGPDTHCLPTHVSPTVQASPSSHGPESALATHAPATHASPTHGFAGLGPAQIGVDPRRSTPQPSCSSSSSPTSQVSRALAVPATASVTLSSATIASPSPRKTGKSPGPSRRDPKTPSTRNAVPTNGGAGRTTPCTTPVPKQPSPPKQNDAELRLGSPTHALGNWTTGRSPLQTCGSAWTSVATM